MEVTEMVDYIFDYLEQNNASVSSKIEQTELETGISKYLLENGIDENETGEYYKNYLKGHLDLIDSRDLKAYFRNYSTLSNINQIIFEFLNDGKITDTRKRDLYDLMNILYKCGLGEKYVPIIEVKQILGKMS